MARIATRTGDSKWGHQSRRPGELVQQMRRETDAVMVGIKTVLADDPALTARDSAGPSAGPASPSALALDSHCRMPAQSQLLHQPGQTLVYTTAGRALQERPGAGRDRGRGAYAGRNCCRPSLPRRKYWRTWDTAGW